MLAASSGHSLGAHARDSPGPVDVNSRDGTAMVSVSYAATTAIIAGAPGATPTQVF